MGTSGINSQDEGSEATEAIRCFWKVQPSTPEPRAQSRTVQNAKSFMQDLQGHVFAQPRAMAVGESESALACRGVLKILVRLGHHLYFRAAGLQTLESCCHVASCEVGPPKIVTSGLFKVIGYRRRKPGEESLEKEFSDSQRIPGVPGFFDKAFRKCVGSK